MTCQAPIKKNPEVSDFRKNWCKSSRGEIFLYNFVLLHNASNRKKTPTDKI
jgi:hypothetical protein